MIALCSLILIVGFATGWVVGVTDSATASRKTIASLPMIERRRYPRHEN